MLDLPGVCVAQDSIEAEVVKESNERYETVRVAVHIDSAILVIVEIVLF